MTELAFSRGRCVRDTQPEQRRVRDFAAFAQALEGDRAGLVKSDSETPYFCGPLNGDGRRCAAGALPKRWTAVDLDHIEPQRHSEVHAWFSRLSGVAWPTHSSSPESLRERVVIELNREATRDECVRLGVALSTELVEAFGSDIKVDVSTFKAEQPCFLPMAGVALTRFSGAPLVVDTYLEKPPPTRMREGPKYDSWGENDLLARLEKGEALHDTIRGFVASLIAKGVGPRMAEVAARGALELARPARGERVDELSGAELKRMIDGAVRKFSPGISDEPIDIFRQVTAPALPPELFPPVLARYAALQAKAAGHDVSAYLVAMLAAAAAAISDETVLMIDPRTHWLEQPRLWLLLLGPPGSAKTPAIRAAMAPILELHRQQSLEYAKAVAAAAKDAPAPPRRAMVINDATVEALSEVLQANPRGILAIYEELDSWIGSHDCYRNGQGSKDRGDWLRAFDGGVNQINRIKRGNSLVDNWGVSIVGATTPSGLRRHAKDLPADGLIQRFLTVIVQPMMASEPSIEQASTDDARQAYARRLYELFSARTGIVRLSCAAAEVFEARRAKLRSEVVALSSFSEPLAGHLAKHAGLLGRLALVVHCLEHGECAVDVELSEDTMRRADDILQRLTKDSMVMYDMLAGDGGSASLARACASSIVAAEADVLTRRDLIAMCRAFKDAPEVQREAALRFLVDAGWVTPSLEGRQYAGRLANFHVNPAVHTRFAAQGSALRERRQAVRDIFAA